MSKDYQDDLFLEDLKKMKPKEGFPLALKYIADLLSRRVEYEEYVARSKTEVEQVNRQNMMMRNSLLEQDAYTTALLKRVVRWENAFQTFREATVGIETE